MTVLNGSFLYLEDDPELSEIILEEWLGTFGMNEDKNQLVFIKSTRAALLELHNLKKEIFYQHGLDKFLWIRNNRVTRDDAMLIMLLSNCFNNSKSADYCLRLFNYNHSYREDELGWNLRRVFDWHQEGLTKLALFHTFQEVKDRYQISDWLSSSLIDSIEIHLNFLLRLSALIRLADEGKEKRNNESRDLLVTYKKEVSVLSSQWESLKAEHAGTKSELIDSFIDFSFSSLKSVSNGREGLRYFYYWKSVLFGAKSKIMLRAGDYDYAYLWCHRSLEEYLKYHIARFDRASFKGDKCWWDGEPVLGVMKYLKILKGHVSDIFLHDNITLLERHVSLRNSSTIGHGSRRISEDEVMEFTHDMVGMINKFDKMAANRSLWLDRVKSTEKIYGGEFLRILSLSAIKKSGMLPVAELLSEKE